MVISVNNVKFNAHNQVPGFTSKMSARQIAEDFDTGNEFEKESKGSIFNKRNFVIATSLAALASIGMFIATRGKKKPKVKVSTPDVSMPNPKGGTPNVTIPPAKPAVPEVEIPKPKTIAQMLESLGIKNDKLVEALEKEGIGLKIENSSQFSHCEDYIKALRETGKYDDVKKIMILSPERSKKVLAESGIDVANLPKESYMRIAMSESDKNLNMELVLADKMGLSIKTRAVHQWGFYDGSFVCDI